MKKTVLIIILAVLVLFCLISIAVGGFFGWRFYQKHKLTEASVKSAVQQQLAQTSPEEEANASEQEANTPEQEANAPEQTEPEQAPPAEQTQPEAGTASRPATQEVQPAPSPQPKATAPEPAPTPARKPAKRSSARRSTPAVPAPAPVTQSQPSSGSEQTSSAPAPAQAPQTAPAGEAAPKKKAPRGTLGLIFETKVEQGEIIIHVDGKVVVAQAFTASGDNRYRLTKGLRLIPGPHRVKVKVVMPDGKKEIKEWTVMVVKGGDTVWKIEMKTFPRTLDIKPIQ